MPSGSIPAIRPNGQQVASCGRQSTATLTDAPTSDCAANRQTGQASMTDQEARMALADVAAWLEDQLRIAPHNLHCGDKPLTISRPHAWPNRLDEAAATLRTSAHAGGEPVAVHPVCQSCKR